MKQVILSIQILNILNIRKALQEVLVKLMMVKLVMMKINETKLAIPLKHLSNFQKSLNVPLINCEVRLNLTWSKNCLLVAVTERDAENDYPAIVAPTKLEFKITNTKLYIPVVTLSKRNDIKHLEQLKGGFKRTIKWNKYRSQMTI